MKEVSCYKCGDKLTKDNLSKEHIIPNASGGYLKSNWLLCDPCNNNFGQQIDKYLKTNHLMNLLMIKRDRGEVQPELVKTSQSNKEYYYTVTGEIVMRRSAPEVEKSDSETHLKIVARDRVELKNTAEGLRRKYPEIDVDTILEKAETRNERLDETFTTEASFGDEMELVAITKIAVNFYLFKEGHSDVVSKVLETLFRKEKGKVFPFFTENLPHKLNSEEVSHILHLVGSPEERILYCYIELFNFQSYMVVLNENYIGAAIEYTYSFDLLNSLEMLKDVSLNLNRYQLLNYEYSVEKNKELVKNRLSRLLMIAHNRHVEREIQNITSKCITKVMGEEFEGGYLTEEQQRKFYGFVSEEMAHFMVHQEKFKK